MKTLLAAFVVSVMTMVQMPRLSDSLAMYERRLNGYCRQAEELYTRIQTPADRKENDVDIQLLRDDLQRLRGESSLISDEPQLNSIYTDCLKCLARIDEKVRLWQLEQTCDSLIRVEAVWQHRLDSMLARGNRLAGQERGDSVKMLKQDLESMWGEVQQIRESNRESWGHNPKLQESYAKLEGTREEIRALSEKEKVKIGDILMKVLIAIGVITVIAGVVGGRIKSAKLKKKAEETPAIEI